MKNSTLPASGYFACGLPYNRFGRGPRPLVVFQGLLFDNKPLPNAPFTNRFTGYPFLEADYTIYLVNRRPGLAPDASLKDMADDYASLIRAEFGGPVDVIGVSTGGSIAHYFAADHPDLVRRLVIHSSAYRLNDTARAFQLRLADLGLQRRWRQAYTESMRFIFAGGQKKPLLEPLFWLAGLVGGAQSRNNDGRDHAVTAQAEDRFDFLDRLGEIRVPTLVAAGECDPYYTPELFRQTAAGIPGARLAIYPGMGHPASGSDFARDVLAFLAPGQP